MTITGILLKDCGGFLRGGFPEFRPAAAPADTTTVLHPRPGGNRCRLDGTCTVLSRPRSAYSNPHQGPGTRAAPTLSTAKPARPGSASTARKSTRAARPSASARLSARTNTPTVTSSDPVGWTLTCSTASRSSA
ncbi:hypothetical protein KCH_42330 [Kitasatospora cheerisanensis KCTC 2395]|uniref:Uncharacterized protein n=1 Tax=Kitasatospora cheerisanensis KCTC 2395 TaxID=1348663 RepID=A0A066YT63_9ACTN|nr:hypothetical protein KCH_42330 [Kitasatospora cheerisanensis KCTC 2395]